MNYRASIWLVLFGLVFAACVADVGGERVDDPDKDTLALDCKCPKGADDKYKKDGDGKDMNDCAGKDFVNCAGFGCTFIDHDTGIEFTKDCKYMEY